MAKNKLSQELVGIYINLILIYLGIFLYSAGKVVTDKSDILFYKRVIGVPQKPLIVIAFLWVGFILGLCYLKKMNKKLFLFLVIMLFVSYILGYYLGILKFNLWLKRAFPSGYIW
jgi:hypothetical protein